MLKEKSRIFNFNKKEFKNIIQSDRSKKETIKRIEKEYVSSNYPLKKLPLYSTMRKWGIPILATSIVCFFGISAEILRELGNNSGLNFPLISIATIFLLVFISMLLPVNNNRKNLIEDFKNEIFLNIPASNDAILSFKKEEGIDAYKSLLYFNPVITNGVLLDYNKHIKEQYFERIKKMNEIKKIGDSF